MTRSWIHNAFDITFSLLCTTSLAYGRNLNNVDQMPRGAFQSFALSEVVIQPHGSIESLHRLGRRQQAPTPIENNVPQATSINATQIHYWMFSSQELDGPMYSGSPVVPPSQAGSATMQSEGETHQELRRQSQRTVYITLNVCTQPVAASGASQDSPPPLSLYVSNSDDNKNPGPNYQGTSQTAAINTQGGRAFHEVGKSGDTYIGVSAPSLNGFSGFWSYQLAVSNQVYYTGSFPQQSLRVLDSDSSSAFFVTDGLTSSASNDTSLRDQWLNTGGPFGIFIYDANDAAMAGVNQSYCGLMNYALIKGHTGNASTNGMEVGMNVFNDTVPYQQFYIGGLNKSTSYQAALALPGNYSLAFNSQTPAGGGSVWQSIDFATHSDDTNCQLIYNLTFCEDVAYSVPTNSSFYNNMTGLAATYDNYTSGTLWQYFRNSLDQIPCNTSEDAKYSLARDCDDCARAYKKWVCAVSIPRCASLSSDASFLKLRNTQQSGLFRNNSMPDPNNPDISNVTNAQSRNMNLTNWLKETGPYKEVLPCDQLCYDLVQSCPSILGFGCPWRGRGLEWGYGTVNAGQNMSFVDGYPVCNMPGAIWGISRASISLPSIKLAVLMAVFAGSLM